MSTALNDKIDTLLILMAASSKDTATTVDENALAALLDGNFTEEQIETLLARHSNLALVTDLLDNVIREKQLSVAASEQVHHQNRFENARIKSLIQLQKVQNNVTQNASAGYETQQSPIRLFISRCSALIASTRFWLTFGLASSAVFATVLLIPLIAPETNYAASGSGRQIESVTPLTVTQSQSQKVQTTAAPAAPLDNPFQTKPSADVTDNSQSFPMAENNSNLQNQSAAPTPKPSPDNNTIESSIPFDPFILRSLALTTLIDGLCKDYQIHLNNHATENYSFATWNNLTYLISGLRPQINHTNAAQLCGNPTTLFSEEPSLLEAVQEYYVNVNTENYPRFVRYFWFWITEHTCPSYPVFDTPYDFQLRIKQTFDDVYYTMQLGEPPYNLSPIQYPAGCPF